MPGKKKVDDGRPKRPQSAYFIFMNESRKSINEENPGLSVSEFGKLAGQMWKDMEDEDKKVLYSELRVSIGLYKFVNY